MARKPQKKRGLTGDTEITQMAVSIFEKVREIKRSNRNVARRIDRLELEIRNRLEKIRNEINRLDKHDQDLVTILVINGVHRSTEEVLVT